MAKSIIFKAKFRGQGIVNYDSNDQKYYYNRTRTGANVRHDNVMFGKGRFTFVSKNDDGKETWDKTNVISADFVRHHMYAEEMSVHMPNVMHNDQLLIQSVATKAALERGYMFAKSETWKRKSPFQISYLTNVSNAVSTIETYSNSQQKIGDNENKGTSFYLKEVLGDTEYVAEGFVDLSELGFISMSEIHDRMSVNPDLAGVYRHNLSQHLGSEVSPIKYWNKINDMYQIPEKAIKLTDDQVRMLAKDIFRRLVSLQVFKNGGFVVCESVDILLVDDPTVDNISSEDGWISIKNGNVVNLEIFDSVIIDSAYVEVTNTDEKCKFEEYKLLKAKDKKTDKKSTAKKTVVEPKETECLDNSDNSDD